MNKSYYWKPSITTLFKVDAKILSTFSESILQFPIIKNMEPPINGVRLSDGHLARIPHGAV